MKFAAATCINNPRTTSRKDHEGSTSRLVAIADWGSFHRALVAAMRPMSDPDLARGMCAYMRGQFDYLGIPTPLRRKTAIVLIRTFRPKDAGQLRKATQALWPMTEREYQYIAVDLLQHHHALLGVKDLPWLLKLAQDKPWWDTVDSIATVVSRIVRRERIKGQPAMDRALRARSFWVRRIAMIHQLGWREETDTKRLFSYADSLAQEQEFFIRKAIGWALRDYAWHDPNAVRKYLARESGRLSSLTYREAGKHCLSRR
jgi:3-methyladenine DNA glycosylase AlkD